MTPLPRRMLLAVAAIVDIALHARGRPVASRELAARLGLPPRHLETLLQRLVREGLLKGTRGPRGGYELARERRRISVADIARVIWAEAEESADMIASPLLDRVIAPRLDAAGTALIASLEAVSVEELCRDALKAQELPPKDVDFTI